MKLRRGLGSAVVVVLGVTGSVLGAGVIHNESVNGDLSGDRLNPNAFTLTAGVSSIIATSNTGDREYVALTIPGGLQLSSVVPASYAGTDTTAFIGFRWERAGSANRFGRLLVINIW